MSAIEGIKSLQTPQITDGFEDSLDFETSSSLTSQIALIVIGFISILFVYRSLVPRNSNRSILNRIRSKGSELGHKCYQTYRYHRISLTISNKIGLWEDLLYKNTQQALEKESS